MTDIDFTLFFFFFSMSLFLFDKTTHPLVFSLMHVSKVLKRRKSNLEVYLCTVKPVNYDHRRDWEWVVLFLRWCYLPGLIQKFHRGVVQMLLRTLSKLLAPTSGTYPVLQYMVRWGGGGGGGVTGRNCAKRSLLANAMIVRSESLRRKRWTIEKWYSLNLTYVVTFLSVNWGLWPTSGVCNSHFSGGRTFKNALRRFESAI